MSQWVFVPTADGHLDHICRDLARYPSWTVRTLEPESGDRISADPGFRIVVVPLSSARRLLPAASDACPVLPYGSPEVMGHAFLMGAPDFLCEPFTTAELLVRAARCREPAGLRGRPPEEQGRVVETSEGHGVLSGRELELWELLRRHAGRTVERDELARVWYGSGHVPQPGERALDMAVSRLRHSLHATGIRILAVRGRGYRAELP